MLRWGQTVYPEALAFCLLVLDLSGTDCAETLNRKEVFSLSWKIVIK